MPSCAWSSLSFSVVYLQQQPMGTPGETLDGYSLCTTQMGHSVGQGLPLSTDTYYTPKLVAT